MALTKLIELQAKMHDSFDDWGIFCDECRDTDFAALDEKIKRYEEALRTIAEYGDEENEWDAADKYNVVRDVANQALEQSENTP